MNEAELIKQFNTLLEYLLDNSQSLNDDDFVNCISTIYTILESNCKCESNKEDLTFIEKMIQDGTVSLFDFYRRSYTALTKYLSGRVGELTKEKLLYAEKENIFNRRFYHLDNIREVFNKRYRERTDRFKGKGVIYSVITGGYDRIIEPEYEGNLEYILLTDKAPKDYKGKWQIREIDNASKLSANRFARYMKMHPFKFFSEYDWSVYVDGKQKVVGDFNEYIDLFGKKCGMICFPHYDTNTLKAQAHAIASNGKASMEDLEKQIKDYESRGYKEKGFMVETACLVRDHHDETLKKVMEDWWNELNSYNHNRDQMSFDYACWKNNYEYDLCNHLIYNNPWCIGEVVHK
jgi:hypothetical protein